MEEMERIAQFNKVSYKQFNEGMHNNFEDIDAMQIAQMYSDIKFPARATKGSAGYDFYLPLDVELKPGETITIPTGINCFMKQGWVLQIYPRSGFGFKYRLRLNNTVGIIDSDYYSSDNEGHIFIRMTNESPDKVFSAKAGTGFAQGIFNRFGITFDDKADENRNGGFGSTGV